MAKVSTNISLDPELKEKASILFSGFGLDLSTAITLFLQQSVREQRIPFEIRMNLASREPLFIDDLTEEEFNQEIKKGMDDIERGDVYSLEEVKQYFKNLKNR